MIRSRSSRALALLGVALLAAWILTLAAGRCGDGVCEGPETSANCPADCLAEAAAPNPIRAVVSEEILTWRNRLEDGGFEAGTAGVELRAHPVARLASASAARTPEAARSGAYGMRIEAGLNEGIVFALPAKIEKGERTRCSFWARAPLGPATVRLSVLDADASRDGVRVLYSAGAAVEVGGDWTQVAFTFANTQGVDTALLAIEIGPSTTIDVDDATIDSEEWALPEAGRFERIVGGIPVPLEPRATFHFNVLIHVEDPTLMTAREGYFREKTAVFTELARVLHEHGGLLTIQPEEDWPRAALAFAPETLADLAERYGVVYSTHTHGPACVDPDGRLRSSADCNACRRCPGWQTIEQDADPTTPTYVGALRDLIAEVSGTDVSDHNGNFHYANPSALAEAGIATWSAFKDHNTQATFDRLFTNPWRPTACDAIETPELFQTHDRSTPIVFIPGWGQAITRHPERLHERLAAMLSQVLRYADPDRVNTFYIVTHVDHYRGDGEPYIAFDETTGEITLHEAFYRDLGYWEETLTDLVDPLVAEGYLTWTSLPTIGQLFVRWEEASRED